MKRFGIERPDMSTLSKEQFEYVSLVELVAKAEHAQEVKSSMDPRTWPLSTLIAAAGCIVTAFLWAFNSGGEWKQVESRLTAVELKQNASETVFARRDLLEQQMSYVVSGLNELKLKVDQLTTASVKR